MDTATNTGGKPAHATQGKPDSAVNAQSAPLLNRKNRGLHLVGTIDAVNPPTHREGQTDKGKKYSFHQQTVTLALGGSSADINFRSDSPFAAPLTEDCLDEIRSFKVTNPRLYNGKLSFDVVE